MKTSQRGIDLIKEFSNFSLRAYIDAMGVTKIGYNHATDLAVGTRITEQVADELLRTDLLEIEQSASKFVRHKLTQYQFDAIVSFLFSSKMEDFLKSTLLKKVRINPNDTTIAAEFAKWIHAGGKVFEGLRRRRLAEAELYFTKEEKEGEE